MTAAEEFLADLESALHVRGRARRRLLAECRDHLTESSAAYGAAEAVRRFGPAADLARSFESEVAARRGLRATALSVAGVLAVGASTLVMVNAADAGSTAPIVWAVVFFGSAQVSAVSLVLAVLRAGAMRREIASPTEVALLCRRNAFALGFALLTMFAAGGAVPGQAAAWKIAVGPAIAVVAAVSLIRARRLVRALDSRRAPIVRPPLIDAVVLTGRAGDVSVPAWSLRSGPVLAVTVAVAAAAASCWDLLDHGSVTSSGSAAAIEAVMVVAGFVLLGRGLGLRPASNAR